MDCFKAVDKSNRVKRVVLNEIQPACDRYVAKLEGESPLRALVRRTVREGKGVHREVESEESRIQNAGLTNRKRI
jgi:hypothetical protein